ncbi:sensor histidine kinase [Amycolatopsis sp. NPDC059027]|uniref:sensor histidine kinase n=1 Tax=unclassified Amycolatopsis TaxID=2618356 RepID=UPI00366FC04A
MARSLLVRLLAVSALIVLCSIAATAWLAARTTSGAIRQEQGQALAEDSRIYQDVLKYAATHPDWRDVPALVQSLGRSSGRRIVLATSSGGTIADSAPRPGPLPKQPSVVVDPLSVDAGLGVSTSTDRIDPDAVGPYALAPDEREFLAQAGARALSCVRKNGGSGSLVTEPNGRTRVESSDPYTLSYCSKVFTPEPVHALVPFGFDVPTKTEQAALDKLTGLVNECLGRAGRPPVQMMLGFTWVRKEVRPSGPDPAVDSCIAASRREQLTPYVAPAASLYLMSAGDDQPSGFTLSAENKVRLAAVAGAVLVIAVAVTVLAGIRLIRPLRALTGAAQRMEAGETGARVEVRGRDEIARLATAFNDMSAARERLEATRRGMVSDIAHELRTPLSNIRGWIEAVQDGVAQPDDELLALLHEQAVHLQHIVDDLQDLALADAGELRVHPEPLDANTLLTQVAAAHVPRAEAAGVTLSVSPLADPDLTADPVRLRQALDNLVSNAVRHTPAGGTVSVRGKRDGEDVVFEVADTGTGIGEEDLPHVFDRFWRADRSRARQSGGSGLGLAIVRKLAEAHGGTVTAASVPGAGSTFTLRLPG